MQVEPSAHRIADLETAAEEDRLERLVMPAADGLADLPSVVADSELAGAVGHGAQLSARGLDIGWADDRPFRVLDQSGELLAVYRLSGRKAVAEVVLS
jgi:tRNA U55 pseudouridine synthase TruB